MVGELGRPDTEASLIAEVHLSDRILQDQGRVTDGEHIVGADSTLHYPSFLPGVTTPNNSEKLRQHTDQSYGKERT
jgi:hypothetical protein